jgi:hypothetical protein
VLFGERVPARTLAVAAALVAQADLLLVIGCAMDVSPASELPILAALAGARVVEIKRQPSRLSGMVPVFHIAGAAEDVLPALCDSRARLTLHDVRVDGAPHVIREQQVDVPRDALRRDLELHADLRRSDVLEPAKHHPRLAPRSPRRAPAGPRPSACRRPLARSGDGNTDSGTFAAISVCRYGATRGCSSTPCAWICWTIASLGGGGTSPRLARGAASGAFSAVAGSAAGGSIPDEEQPATRRNTRPSEVRIDRR